MIVPKRWRERAGVLRGGPVRLIWLEDEECEDSLLAAHGLELGFGIATLNASHFKPTGVLCAEF